MPLTKRVMVLFDPERYQRLQKETKQRNGLYNTKSLRCLSLQKGDDLKVMKRLRFLGILLAMLVLISASPGSGLFNGMASAAGNEPCQQCQSGGSELQYEYPIMRPSRETLLRWIEQYNNLPKAYINPQIQCQLQQSPETYGASLSLLDHLQYTPSERNQGSCGNCWVWAGTGIMGVALDVQNTVKDRLSIQYLNSNYNGGSGDDWACCGGLLPHLANFYAGTEKAIPWSNTNASWQDGSRTCASGSTNVPADTISTNPNYSISSITAGSISTHGVGEDMAIANIKNVLLQDKAMQFSFYLPTAADWNNFFDFWGYQTEDVIWNPDFSCGHTWVEGEGGGHAVLCVGYNDEDGTANDYWIILNSWGTASGGRPKGLFRLDMHMDYDCYSYPPFPNGYYSFYWETLDIDFGALAPTVTNLPASHITSTSARLNGEITDTGGQDPTVHIYWGDNDGGTTPGNWDHDENLGTKGAGSFYTDIANLDPETTYYYRCYATNSGGEDWADSTESFDTIAAGAMVIEVGELSLDHNWQTVNLTNSFTAPAVVAKPLSYNGANPSVVRIRNVTSSSFDIRLQEWSYLDGTHYSPEGVSWLAMEKGHWTLPNGAEVETGSITTDSCGTGSFASVGFSQAFSSAPVVISSVMTFNGGDAVATRNRNITTSGFDVIMQEQESNMQTHTNEVISYVAWESGSGTVDSINYEVGSQSGVNHDWSIVGYGAFGSSPYLLVDMQTTNGDNSCNLRYKNKTGSSVEIKVDEEQSEDSEKTHTNENVGYFAFVS